MAPPTYQSQGSPTTSHDDLFTASSSSQDTRPRSMQQTTMASVHAMIRAQEMHDYHNIQHVNCAPPRARSNKRARSPSRVRCYTTKSTTGDHDQPSPGAPQSSSATQNFQNALSISSDESRSAQESDETLSSTNPSHAEDPEEGRPSKKVKIERAGTGAEVTIASGSVAQSWRPSEDLIGDESGEEHHAGLKQEHSSTMMKVERHHEREVSEADSWPDFIAAVKPEPFRQNVQAGWAGQTQPPEIDDQESDTGSNVVHDTTFWDEKAADDVQARADSSQMHYAHAHAHTEAQTHAASPLANPEPREDYLTPAARELANGFMRQYNLIVAEREEREAREAHEAHWQNTWAIAGRAPLPEHLRETLPQPLPEYHQPPIPADMPDAIPAAEPDPIPAVDPDAIPADLPEEAILSDADIEAIQYEARIELLNRDLNLAREGLELGRRIIEGLQRSREALQRDRERLIGEREGWLRERERLMGEVREARAGEEAAESKYAAAKMVMRARMRH
ncbi:hypothetical protein BDZ85DRAFT_17814 [Elsinoe ampelina]|uniref:Uncharacterized protein n=1 Tax=Elsinoe ampelina TaxID=302913 RepID=A0A6A6G7G8_9PEZI|nr:hypothetical protein BDZ85DRAFT_17814 [Elsinoe ampelina]